MDHGRHGVNGRNVLQRAQAEQNQDIDIVTHLLLLEKGKCAQGHQQKQRNAIQRNAPVNIV